jgi:hypothetical protein
LFSWKRAWSCDRAFFEMGFNADKHRSSSTTPRLLSWKRLLVVLCQMVQDILPDYCIGMHCLVDLVPPILKSTTHYYDTTQTG